MLTGGVGLCSQQTLAHGQFWSLWSSISLVLLGESFIYVFIIPGANARVLDALSVSVCVCVCVLKVLWFKDVCMI